MQLFTKKNDNNPKFSWNYVNDTVIGSDLDPNYDYVIVQEGGESDGLYDFLNTEELETTATFDYDVRIYYYNISDLEDVKDAYNSCGDWQVTHKEFPDLVMYYGILEW